MTAFEQALDNCGKEKLPALPYPIGDDEKQDKKKKHQVCEDFHFILMFHPLRLHLTT